MPTDDPYRIGWLIEHQVLNTTFGQALADPVKQEIAKAIIEVMNPVVKKAIDLGRLTDAERLPKGQFRNPDGVIPEETGVVFLAKFKDSPDPRWRGRDVLFMRQVTPQGVPGQLVMPHGAEWYTAPDEGEDSDVNSGDLVDSTCVDPASVRIQWEPTTPYDHGQSLAREYPLNPF